MAKPKFTRWFSIDKDGQPIRKGWYEVLYEFESEDGLDGTTRYWSGTQWRWSKNSGPTAFGNLETTGERWRGLSQEPIKVTESDNLGAKP